MTQILTPSEIDALPPEAKMNGILHPLMQHRFRILFGNLTRAEADLLTMQVTDLEFDLLRDQYTLTLEQPLFGTVKDFGIVPVGNAFLEAIRALCKGLDFKIRAEILDGCETVIDVLLDGLVHVIKHEAALSYSSANVMTHRLTLKPGMRPWSYITSTS